MPDYEDILQVGCEATLKALTRVKDGADDKAVRGYVGKYIEGYVIRYLDYNKHKVHVPYQLINEVNVLVDSIDYEFSDGEGKTKTYEELFLADTETGYEEAEVKVDFDRFTATLKPKYKRAFELMSEVEDQKTAGHIMGYVRGERVRQMIREYKREFDRYVRAVG